jgi:ribosomal protein L40E
MQLGERLMQEAHFHAESSEQRLPGWSGAGAPEPSILIRAPRKRVLGNARRVLCCIVPHDGHMSITVALLVLVPVVVFLTSVVPSDDVASFIVVPVFTVFALLCLMCAVTVDPGVLIPAPPDPSLQPQLVEVNGAQFECKICTTCNIVRPPRSSHCRQCDWCVDEYDHHCGVLGSCVAKRTFRFFSGFISFSFVLAAYIFVRCVILLVAMDFSKETSSDGGRWKLVATFGCAVYCALGGCCVSGQCGFYMVLGCNNQTQKECNRSTEGLLNGPRNPFSEGPIVNFVKRFFGSLGPSRLSRNAPEFV